jgi:hypothetical protein
VGVDCAAPPPATEPTPLSAASLPFGQFDERIPPTSPRLPAPPTSGRPSRATQPRRPRPITVFIQVGVFLASFESYWRGPRSEAVSHHRFNSESCSRGKKMRWHCRMDKDLLEANTA